MNPFTDILPAKARRVLYALLAFAGLVLGAFQVATVPDTPHWVDVALKVLGYIGSVLGLVAASNVSTNNSPPGEEGATNTEFILVVILVLVALLCFGVLPR